MGAEVLQEFLARLGFQIDEAGLQKFNSGLATAATRAAAFGVGITAAATAAVYGIYKVAENNAELLKTSEALGMTVEKLREMNFVAEMTGGSTEALKSSLQGLQASMAGALIGGGGLATFARLGIRIKDANGHLRDTSEVLMEVGKRIKTMDRAKGEMFLGQLGIDKGMYKTLTSDIRGITDAYREMYAATGTNAQKAAEDSRDFVKEVKMLKTMLGLLAESVSLAFIKKLGGDATRLRKMLVENFGKITKVLQSFLGLVLRIAGFVGAIVLRAAQFVGVLVGWFQKLDGTVQMVILGVLGFAAAWKFLNLAFLATPIGLIITGLVALVALIDDFMTYLEGGESLLDWGPWASSILMVWDVLKGFFSFTVDGFKTLAEMVWNVIKPWTELAALAGKGISAVVDMVSGGGDKSAPALGPSPAFAAATAGGGSNTELNANTSIYIDGAGDPKAVGDAVAGKQQRVNADLVRNTRGAAR